MFTRQSTILSFIIKDKFNGKLKAKDRFASILLQMNKMDKLGKEKQITNVHKQQEEERENKLMNQRFTNSSHDFGTVDVAYMASILQFKSCITRVFKGTTIGEKYLSLKRNLWLINPTRSEDFTNLIVLR